MSITETRPTPGVVAPAEVLIEEARTRRRRRWLATAVVLAVAAASALAALVSVSDGARPGAAAHAPVAHLVDRGYPATACDPSHPTALLLPPEDLPGTRLSPGPAYASGGAALNPFALVTAGSGEGPTSAAVIAEQLLLARAPRAAVQNADPFNLAHPDSITTFSEGITGFTDAGSEALFYSRGLPSEEPPQSVVNGRPVPEELSSSVDDPAFPTPNEVTGYSLPGTDTPGVISVTIESGATVIGFMFEGGSALSLRTVDPIVTTALGIIAASCHGTDVMPTSSRH